MMNRSSLGNSGNVRSWNDNSKVCRALVREDGKILSPVDCWEGLDDFQLPSNKGRIIEKADGPYLVEPRKRYDL